MHRVTPLRLVMMMRSGAHLSVVSNRLASSSPRARFLGMVIGEALSSLVDTEDKKMDFKVEEMSTPEAKWYKSLVEVSDSIGTLDVLRPGKETERVSEPQARPPKLNRNPRGAPMGSKIMAIKEVETDEEEEIGSEDDGLPQYAKPDSDEEDSDEDATLITRNKPTAPVYIRDLITYLRDTENYDHQKLGLVTAAPLIRRKANYGTEVSAHAEEVATLLVGLQDKYDIENFQDMRLQGMIAVLIALPQKMGQWFAKTFFDGDYSLSQRASILTTLGLGAREIGGFGEDDVALSSAKHDSASSFPSRTLPAVMHKYYASSPAKPPLLKSFTNQSNQDDGNVISLLTTAISKTMIAPLVSSANKTLHGPALLQTRTFSTRQAVNAARKKPTTNALAQIVSTSFFFPLTGRLSLLLSSSRASAFPALSSPFLLSHLLKTLALLLHASGPNTLSLPQMTAEFWDLLLALRVRAHGDVAVMEGLLFCFLTILEINEDKYQLVEAQGRQLLETQEWVEGIFSRLGNSASGGVIQGLTGGGGQAVSEEDDKIRMLAAAVLVRLRECVEKYQALLMGDLASF
jgi:telomere length regulation protein